MSTFRGFLSELKAISGPTSAAALEDVSSLMKRSNAGIAAVDDAIKGLAISTNSQNLVTVAGQPIGAIHTIVREGNLRQLINLTDAPNVRFSSADDAAFKKLIGKTPERANMELREASRINKQKYPNMDATAESASLLPSSGKANIKKAESNLAKHYRIGTSIALTTGLVIVGTDWAIKATRAKKGCYMSTLIDNKLTSCKVSQYSCTEWSNQGSICSGSFNYYNVIIVLMTLAKRNDDDEQKIEIARAADINASELSKRLTYVIDNKFNEVENVIRRFSPAIATEPCKITHPDIDSGIVPACRMCSPSASPLSTAYIDPSQYADNITFICNANPSLLDTITDAAISTGINLFQGIGTGLGALLKPLAIIAAIIVALIVIATIVIKFFPKKQTDIVMASSLSSSTPSSSIYGSTETLLPRQSSTASDY